MLPEHDLQKLDPGLAEKAKSDILKPLDTFYAHKDYSVDKNVNPNFIKPQMFMFRLQKIMDEYAGGVSSGFRTSKPLMEKGLEYLQFLKEDADKLGAEDTHELMRCWENIHRLWQAEAHIHTMLFREETRWPGYYFRTDYPQINQEWKCFVNCCFDHDSGKWNLLKKDIIDLVK
jgi:adenylylsulfate reductase subunit A